MADILHIACWVLGDDPRSAFVVNIDKSMYVDTFKEAIKAKKPAFKDMAAGDLRIWKVSSLLAQLAGITSPQEVPGAQEQVNPLSRLSTAFPVELVDGHVHVIVVPPGTSEEREKTLDLVEIHEKINKEFDSLQGIVETFLKNPEPHTWIPPDSATPSNRQFLTNLRIPSYRNGNPSLLFHDLDDCDDNELQMVFGPGAHQYICNTSGSGKTRRMLEGLTKYWGFYLVAIPDVTGVGIRDLQDALDDVAESSEWVSDLEKVNLGERAAQNKVNSRIASRHLRKVLAARVVVFQLFLQLAIRVHGALQEKHKRIWLLFQLSDQLIPSSGLHPFVRIIRNCLYYASNEALDALVKSLDDIRSVYLLDSHFILGLDEAQCASRMYPRSFISSTHPHEFRSIIREVVKVFTKSPIKLIVSATSLSLAEFEDAVTYGVSNPAEAVQLFHRLGMFDTWPKLKSFLERYVPASILESHSGYRLQQRMRGYLLGRYQFTISFVEYFLRNGLESPHKLLNKFIKAHTGCLPGDTGEPFTSKEPDLQITVRMLGFEWDRLQLDSSAVVEAVQIVQSHLLQVQGQSPTYGPVTARLVEYGIAFLREEHKGQIVEPLAFLSLMKWLQAQGHLNPQC